MSAELMGLYKNFVGKTARFKVNHTLATGDSYEEWFTAKITDADENGLSVDFLCVYVNDKGDTAYKMQDRKLKYGFFEIDSNYKVNS